ncbi:MAG: class B sortase [Lachnospiraceae bacterium]|nr:class B sortase [Lachnospiraceae bacterium]
MVDSRTSTLRDEAIIKSITEGLDLNNPNDIRKVYQILQTGSYNFESSLGRDFDDEIYEKFQKVLSGEIKEVSLEKGKKAKVQKKAKVKDKDKNKKDIDSLSDTSKVNISYKNSKDYEKNLDLLVELELKKREKRRKLLLLVASMVALVSLGYFGVYYFMSSRTTTDYEALAELKNQRTLINAKPQETFSVNLVDQTLPPILPEYQLLYEKNKRMIGWLNIGGTKIDYPVMQTVDNEYYLTHNFNQEKDNNGSLFLDYNCKVYPRSTNMIIYGHHMKSGNMFGNLQKYAKESYGKEHQFITFDTLYEHATYQVMYVFYSKVYDTDELVFKYYQFINANSAKEFDYYMSEMESLSLYDTGVKAKFGDKLLTLSTCDHSQTDGRFAVVAKRIS